MTEGGRPRAVVTGASAGIGRAIASELARRGHDLVLVARREVELGQVAATLRAEGAAVEVMPADLADPATPFDLAQRLERSGTVIDVLVNNAGFGDSRPFAECEAERSRDMTLVNMTSLVTLTRLLLPGMLARRRGRLMMLASTAAFQPTPGMALYGATKAFVLSFGEGLSEELRGSGVTVTTLCPGATWSEFAKVAKAENRAIFKRGSRLVMSAEEVARQGVEAMLADRRLVVTGLHNRLATSLSPLMPRSLLLPLAHRMMRGGE